MTTLIRLKKCRMPFGLLSTARVLPTRNHIMCPPGADSWCKYQRAKAEKKLKSFKHDYTAMPKEVVDAIKPIYESLINEELLQTCIGGFIQNRLRLRLRFN